MKRTACVAGLLLAAATARAGEKEIFNAMQEEISRAAKDLRIEGMAAPYFISLRMQDTETGSAAAAFGSLFQKGESRWKAVQALVRVGSPELDSSNFREGPSFGFMDSQSVSIPYEDDIVSLRQAFWLSIDEAYKAAVEKLSRKKGFLEKHPQEEYPPDFLPAPGKSGTNAPKATPVNMTALVPYVEAASSHLRSMLFLTEGIVTLSIFETTQYFMDTEGTRAVRSKSLVALKANLRAYTTDWYPVGNSVKWLVREAKNLPKLSEVTKKLDEAAKYLRDVLDQKPLESYSGPVVFSGEAAGGFFLNLLGKGVSKPREYLASEENAMFGAVAGNLGLVEGFLAKRFGKKVMPASFDAWDRPAAKEWKGTPLVGSMTVDDEGVGSKNIQLVKRGVLSALPMRRTALKKFKDVNGHARAPITSLPEGRVTNIFIEDAGGLGPDAFLKKVRSIASEKGVEEVLVVTRMGEVGFRDADPSQIFSMLMSAKKRLLPVPVEMFIMDARTGKTRPVWGLEFEDASEKALLDIKATTKEKTLYQSEFRSEDMTAVSAAVVAPDILIEDMSLLKAKVEKLRTPAVPMPEIRPAEQGR